MQKPQIQIINSRVYNDAIRRWLGRDDYLSDEELDQYRSALEAKWRENSDEILGLIVDCLGWPWDEAVVRAYVTGTKASFSNPLTIGYRKNIEKEGKREKEKAKTQENAKR